MNKYDNRLKNGGMEAMKQRKKKAFNHATGKFEKPPKKLAKHWWGRVK